MAITLSYCLVKEFLSDKVIVGHRLYVIYTAPAYALIRVDSVYKRLCFRLAAIGTGIGLNTVCIGSCGGCYLTVIPNVICDYLCLALADLLVLSI